MVSRSMNSWNYMQSYRCMYFFLERSQNFLSIAKVSMVPSNLLTILEEFSSSTFGPSGPLLIFTELFLELKLYSFPTFFPLHWKIKNFQESSWNVLAFCAQSLSWMPWIDIKFWRKKIKSLKNSILGAQQHNHFWTTCSFYERNELLNPSPLRQELSLGWWAHTVGDVLTTLLWAFI